jgi:hypothetical protein
MELLLLWLQVAVVVVVAEQMVLPELPVLVQKLVVVQAEQVQVLIRHRGHQPVVVVVVDILAARLAVLVMAEVVDVAV